MPPFQPESDWEHKVIARDSLSTSERSRSRREVGEMCGGRTTCASKRLTLAIGWLALGIPGE